MDNIEKYINNEAKSIVLNKLEKSQNSVNELSDIVFDSIEKIKDTYNL
jgi:hypothetical protein